MRLSEAIRLGAMLHPQCFGVPRVQTIRDGKEFTLRTCAIGAASEAGYVWGVADDRVSLFSMSCPVDNCIRGSLVTIIAKLNDRHRWTREAIADFVQTVEQPEPAPAVDPIGAIRGTEGATREKAYV